MFYTTPINSFYYFSVIFNAMDNFLNIKINSFFDEKNIFFYKNVVVKIQNHPNISHLLYFQKRFFEILFFNNLEKNVEFYQQKEGDFQFIYNSSSELTKIDNIFFEKSSENQKIALYSENSNDELVIKSSNNKNNLLSHEFLYNPRPKNINDLKNYFSNLLSDNLLNNPKISINSFREKKLLISIKALEKQNENQDLRISGTDQNNKVNILKEASLTYNFIQIFKSQFFAISVNKTENIVPFALVAYHFKENEKNANTKRKKKKKKILFQKDIKYLDEEVYI